MPANRSRLGRVSTWLGRLCVLGAILGPVLAHFEFVQPMTGFTIFAAGLALGVLALALGLLALALGPAPSRASTAAGIIPPVVVIAAVLLTSSFSHGAPPINDISTDTANPPQFVHAQTLDGNIGRDMSYSGEAYAAQQRAAYPDLMPVTLALPPEQAFVQVAAAARSMNSWVITREDAASRTLEGYDTTPLFRFKDDFIIEVRPTDNGQSIVQMRSKSRDGKSDLGANAARIRAFLARLSN
ncbi:MAG: DUF1499 domain-containing protein [Candidatus Binatia bacterium]